MRTIIKTALGSNVLDRQEKIGVPQTKEESEQRWGDFGKKSTVRNKLFPQQFFLCGYTEFNIPEFCSKSSTNKHGCHIEHIKPKSIFPNETFNYHNLILSVLDDSDLSKFKKDFFIGHEADSGNDHQLYFAGHGKLHFYDSVKFISPIENDCQRYFRFLEEDGSIVPRENLNEDEIARAVYTIKILNLNHPYLKNQRRKRMLEVSEDIDELEDLEQIKTIIRSEIAANSNGHIASFPSAVSSLVSGI